LTERQQAADEIHNRFFAGIIAEIAGNYPDPGPHEVYPKVLTRITWIAGLGNI
jgi:hypothetical protein